MFPSCSSSYHHDSHTHLPFSGPLLLVWCSSPIYLNDSPSLFLQVFILKHVLLNKAFSVLRVYFFPTLSLPNCLPDLLSLIASISIYTSQDGLDYASTTKKTTAKPQISMAVKWQKYTSVSISCPLIMAMASALCSHSGPRPHLVNCFPAAGEEWWQVWHQHFNMLA